MKADSVKRAMVASAPKLGLSSSNLARLGFGLDSASIHRFAIELFVGGKLSANDTLSLFPRYPLRVVTPVSVAGELVPGGAGVALSGVFAWNKGRIVSAPRITVRTSQGIDPLFTTSAKNWPNLDDTIWSLDKNVMVSAPLGAKPGIDTLSVIVSSDSGYTVEARALLRVVPRDTIPPILRISRPLHDTTVSNETYSLVVVASATDSSGIDSVRIRSSTHVAAPYSDTIYLVVGENPIVVQAWDKFGNTALDTVKITRTKPVGDTTAPKVVRISPLGDTVVSWSTKSLSLSWTVTDDSALARVALNSKELTGASGYFQKMVSLSVGNNSFVLIATDANGNARIDSLHVRRKPDTTGPELRLTAPDRDTSVPYGTSHLLVAVTATDSDTGLDSVKIGAFKHLSAPFADSVDLVPGPNRIVVQAWDKAGNRSERILVVDRAASPGDTTAPVIRRSSPSKDTAVAWSIKTLQLSYSISDDSVLSQVWFNDVVWTGSAGIYQKSVALVVGTNTFRVVAQDAHGNKRHDSLRIVRIPDTTAPQILPTGPSKDTSVAYNLGRILVGVGASDLSGIDSIRIGTITHASDAASDSIALITGLNKIVLQAWDKAGNRAVDTLRITRARDTVLPKIVRATGASEQILSYPSSSSISWTVTDNDSLKSVIIQGQVVQGVRGVFTANIPVLPGTFSIVVVATDRAGNRSADTVKWTSKLMDSRDRKSYRIAAMPDGKIWMAEDLAITAPGCGNSCIDSFYTWSQAMALPDSCDGSACRLDSNKTTRGICPTDWHVPTTKEWLTLIDSSGIVHLKAASGWTVTSGGSTINLNGDDQYGFAMLPRTMHFSGSGVSRSAEWWTPNYSGGDDASSSNFLNVDKVQSNWKGNSKQVRCVRD
jgi:uncharacterized protein (TIGR02145 family)